MVEYHFNMGTEALSVLLTMRAKDVLVIDCMSL